MLVFFMAFDFLETIFCMSFHVAGVLEYLSLPIIEHKHTQKHILKIVLETWVEISNGTKWLVGLGR